MIYNIFMRYILIVITVLFSLNIFSKELIIDVFGKEEVKTYAIDENNFFRMVTTKSVFKTNTNIYGNSECAGTTEIYNKNVVLNIICELREGKNKGYYVLKNNNTESSKKDEVTELAIKVLFIGGSGRWKKLKGQSCNFVYFEYEEGASHGKVKCDIDEKLFSFFKN